MSKARKAVAAFITGTIGAIGASLLAQGPPSDAAGWAAVIGAGVGAGVLAAFAVYRTRPTSDPNSRII
jgi:O-antigen/teichoic acid export membrane protein